MAHLTTIGHKKLFALIILGLVCTVRCNSPREASKLPSVLDKVKSEGTIRAGYIVYPPFVTKDPNTADLGGLFIDVMAEIARQLGVSIDYQEAKWGNMVTGLQAGDFDTVVSGIFPTIPRSEDVAFARPLMYVGLAGVVRYGETRFTSDADLDRDGIKVAVINGEVGHEYMRINHLHTELVVLNTADIGRAAEEVRVGNADLALTDGLTCYNYVQEYPKETELAYSENPFYVFGVTVMIRRSDPDWQNFLNTSFELLESSSTIDRHEVRYKPAFSI